MGSSVLQQAICEAAGRGAHIQAGSPGYVDLPVVKRCLEFEASATNVWHVFTEETDRGIGWDGGTWLVEFLFIDEDSTGKDEGTGALAAGNQATVNEQYIDTDFCSSSGQR
jgi:hypothetical protein